MEIEACKYRSEVGECAWEGDTLEEDARHLVEDHKKNGAEGEGEEHNEHEELERREENEGKAEHEEQEHGDHDKREKHINAADWEHPEDGDDEAEPENREEEFPCDFEGCGRILPTRRILKEHKKYAHGPEHRRPFECDFEGCGKKCTTAQGLANHQTRAHVADEKKPFKCEVTGCGKAYASAGALKYHTQTRHHGDKDPKPFKCPTCPAAYPELRALNNHRAKRHGVFKCTARVCNFLCSTGEELAAHRAVSCPCNIILLCLTVSRNNIKYLQPLAGEAKASRLHLRILPRTISKD
jgi:hypothetical protein